MFRVRAFERGEGNKMRRVGAFDDEAKSIEAVLPSLHKVLAGISADDRAKVVRIQIDAGGADSVQFRFGGKGKDKGAKPEAKPAQKK